MPARIILSGEGGQGIQLISKIITHAAWKAGKQVSYLPSFGVEQRGGVSISFIQIGSNNITYPKFEKANIVVALSNRALEAMKQYINDQTLLIYDDSFISQKLLDKIKSNIKNYLKISASIIAKEKYSSRVINMIMMGAVSNQLKDIPYSEFEKAILKELENKIQERPELKQLNLDAFRAGINLAQNFDMTTANITAVNEVEAERIFSRDKISWERFPEYCKGCRLCILTCPQHALRYSQDLNFLGTPMPIVDMSKCIGCKQCMHICPEGAIKVDIDNKNERK